MIEYTLVVLNLYKGSIDLFQVEIPEDKTLSDTWQIVLDDNNMDPFQYSLVGSMDGHCTWSDRFKGES